MANAWIKLQTSTPDKAEVLKIARIMGVSKYDALGRLVKFWVWLDSVCVDGVVDGVVDIDVDMLVDHGEFSKALQQVGWIICDNENEKITIPNFEVHNGDSAKKRAQKSKRQTQWRQKKDASVDGVVDASVEKTASTREEKIREDKIDTKPKKPKGFKPPTFEEFKTWCDNSGHKLDAKHIYTYYSDADWHDAKGDKIKNWKQKVRGNWCKEENKKQNDLFDEEQIQKQADEWR